MTVLLNRPYQGRNVNEVAKFSASTETVLIASGVAVASTDASLTTGAITQHTQSGRAAIAAGQSSVVVTNNLVDANTNVYAVIRQAAADTTLTGVQRIVTAAGSFTIFGNATATATVVIDWIILEAANLSGT